MSRLSPDPRERDGAGKGEEVASLRWEDLREGQKFSFFKDLSADDLEDFSRVSGDISPIHRDDAFAKQRGFPGRIAHGFLLASYLSQLVGTRFPGENCLLQTVSLKFVSPALVGDRLEMSACVQHLSPGVKAAVMDVQVANASTRGVLVKGKMQIGFTARL